MAAPLVEVEDTAVRTLVSRVSVLGPDGRSAGLQDVILAEGRIEQVLPAGEGWSVPVARNIDGTGKTLMPGLVDAHIHVESTYAIPGTLRVPSPRDNLNQFLYWGVTTALDLSASRKVTDLSLIHI